MKANKRGFSPIILGIIILAIILIISIVIFAISKNSNLNSNKYDNSTTNKSFAKVEMPLKKLHKLYSTQIYLDTEGKIYDLNKTIDGEIEYSDFTYGTGVVEKNEKYSIVDYTGKTIVDYGKYNYIADYGLCYIASATEGTCLLDVNGNVIDGTLDDYDITKSYFDTYKSDEKGIYLTSKFTGNSIKYGIITCTGTVIAKPKYNQEDIDVWGDNYSNIIVIRAKEDIYIIGKDDYNIKYSFKSSNIGVGSNNSYVADLDKQVIYLFDNTGNMILKIDDCTLKDDETWNKYQVFYTGGNVANNLVGYNYCSYISKDGKYVVAYKDGEVILESTNELKYIMGKDYLFVQNGDNVDVYNEKIKVKTINNRWISQSILTNWNNNGNNLVSLQGDGHIYLYNKSGEAFNSEKYRERDSDTNILIASNGEKVRVMPNGNLLSVKDIEDYIIWVKDENKQEYSNTYFISDDEDRHIVDANCSKIVKIATADSTKLYEEDGILIYCEDILDGPFYAYDLNNKKIILKLDSEITYIDGYKAFYCNEKIYSLDGNEIYSLN